MKHAGKASRAAFKLILGSLVAVLVIIAAGVVAMILGHLITAMAAALILLWLVFAGFTLYFFRDPTARAPQDAGVIVSPAHGTIDCIDETDEKQFMLGRCRRISMFLSVIDVHVQKAPVAGKVIFLEHVSGEFMNAMRVDSAEKNENVLVGLEADESGERIGVRLVAGLIARRIIPWVKAGDAVARGERISLIQFGSRCDLYLPLEYQVTAALGEKVIGGETILARKG